MTDKILLIGGTPWAKNSLQALKDTGFEIILTDVNPKCSLRHYSDHFFNISAIDTNAILDAIISFDSIAIAYCGNDFGAKTAHRINEVLIGRKLIDSDLDIFIDKHKMKSFFDQNDIPTAKGIQVHLSSLDSVDFNYPAIFKPIAASGAIGVRHLSDIGAVKKYKEKFEKDFDEILIEEVLQGTQHDVNGFFVNSEFYPAGLSDRFFVDYPLCYPIYGYSPSRLSQEQQQACYDSLKKIGQSAGLVTGPLKSDVFMCEDGIVRTNEVCLRFHGDITSSNILPNTGRCFPLMQYVQELVPTRAAAIDQYLAKSYFAHQQVVRWDIIESLPGKFMGLDNKEEILQQPDVLEIFINKKIGASLNTISDNRDVLGWFLTCGDDYASCEKSAERVHHDLKVLTDG